MYFSLDLNRKRKHDLTPLQSKEKSVKETTLLDSFTVSSTSLVCSIDGVTDGLLMGYLVGAVFGHIFTIERPPALRVYGHGRDACE